MHILRMYVYIDAPIILGVLLLLLLLSLFPTMIAELNIKYCNYITYIQLNNNIFTVKYKIFTSVKP